MCQGQRRMLQEKSNLFIWLKIYVVPQRWLLSQLSVKSDSAISSPNCSLLWKVVSFPHDSNLLCTVLIKTQTNVIEMVSSNIRIKLFIYQWDRVEILRPSINAGSTIPRSEGIKLTWRIPVVQSMLKYKEGR